MRYALMLTMVVGLLPLGCKKKPQPKVVDKPVVPGTGRTIARLPEPEPMVRPEPRPKPKPIPPAPEPKAKPKPPAERIYIVKKGDTLWGIATRELGDGQRWREVATLNGLTSDRISIGQKLKLPPK